MADSFVSKLITELTAKTTAADTDLVPIADSNGNFFKMTWQKMKQLLLGTKDISGVGDGTVTGAISELNTNLYSEFHYYNSITAIGLTNNASWDDILTALPRGSGLKFASWKDSLPNLTSQAGARQEITVNKCEAGYATIEVWDIGSNVKYYRSHNGNNYTAWKSI